MNMPNNCDPVQWALYNARQAREIHVESITWPELCAHAARVIEQETGAEAGELNLQPYEITVLEMPDAFGELETAIHRAASELENQGEKSSRIALQLLTALAKFHAEIGK